MTDLSEQAPRAPLVLIVEDDESVRRLFVLNLELAGMATLSAGNGQEALELLRAHPVDLVLLDAVMPVLDGHATLAEIRANPATEAISVIFVTGVDDVDALVRGLDAGADDYLEKPIDPEVLVARVRAHLRGRDAWRQSLQQQLGLRARVVQALGRIRVDASPRDGAAAVCACLDGLAPGTSSALVVFDGTGAEVLAASGAFQRGGGGRLPQALAARLREGAVTGAWVEQRGEQPAGSVGVPLASAELAAAAFAPLPGADGPVGVLALAGPHAAVQGDAGHSLATAIDLAPLVAALLRPALEHPERDDARAAAMRERIARQAFAPVFQPIVCLATRRVLGFEALTRFDDGSGPEPVFAEAGALGLGLELEAATARAALLAARTLPEGVWLSINASPALISDRALAADVFEGASRPVVIELTEHDPIGDYGLVRDAIGALVGDIRLSVDDAGSGYACLHHILELRPDYVKLDRGWVTGIDGDPARQALVSGLGIFAERTGGQLIAEGIEEDLELAVLGELGVPLGQGYLLGRPSPTGA